MTTSAAVQYVIRRNGKMALREIARNLRLTQLNVIWDLENDPAVSVSWENPPDQNRVIGASVPTLYRYGDAALQNLPTIEWATAEGLLDQLPIAPDPASASSLVGDFDELAGDVLVNSSTEVQEAAEGGAGGEPPLQPEPVNVEPDYGSSEIDPATQQAIRASAVRLLHSMTLNAVPVLLDAGWNGDLSDLFVWLSRTTYGDSVWRMVRYNNQNAWVPIALHPNLRREFTPDDLVDFLTRSWGLLGTARWREEREVLGLGESPTELWAALIDEEDPQRRTLAMVEQVGEISQIWVETMPQEMAEGTLEQETAPISEIASHRRGIGHGVWLESTVLDPDELVSLKEVIEEAKRCGCGFSQYLVLKAIGGDHCPNPPHSEFWTVYYDAKRRRWLRKEVMQNLVADLTFLQSIARQRAAVAS